MAFVIAYKAIQGKYELYSLLLSLKAGFYAVFMHKIKPERIMQLKHKIRNIFWWFGTRCKWIEKFLCWKGWHNWDFHYIFDKNDPLAKYGHFHIIGGWRKCLQEDCKTTQMIAKEIEGENKIRWEK